MIAVIFKKLIEGATKEELAAAGLGGYYADHRKCPFYVDPEGFKWDAAYTQAKGEPIADLTNDMAAEQKARVTYENLLGMTDDPLLKDTLRFLREREIVHFQRFGEALRLVQEHECSKKFY